MAEPGKGEPVPAKIVFEHVKLSFLASTLPVKRENLFWAALPVTGQDRLILPGLPGEQIPLPLPVRAAFDYQTKSLRLLIAPPMPGTGKRGKGNLPPLGLIPARFPLTDLCDPGQDRLVASGLDIKPITAAGDPIDHRSGVTATVGPEAFDPNPLFPE